MDHELNVTFHGGAGTVTGANFLLEDGETKILIDCGLEQGKEFCESCNFDDFPYDPKEIDALFITHAHLDHIGRAPKLFKDGFNGPVYMTEPTKDLGVVMLDDSKRILGREAERKQLERMYEQEHIDALFANTITHPFHDSFTFKNYTVTFHVAGHILGSAVIHFTHNKTGKTVTFSGDLGNSPAPFLKNIEPLPETEYLIMESVYGDRLHEHRDQRSGNLRRIIKESADRGGALMIPAFSLERTQIMLYEISNMMEEGEIPKLSVFLDSPLAIKVTEIYHKWSKLFKEDVQDEVSQEGNIFNFPFLVKTETRDESKAIFSAPDPKIIIAGAGMSHGGRIQHHEMHYLSDPKNTLLIVGYQSPGSMGRLLQDGAKTVRIFDKEVKVRAKIETITGFSAHADRDALLDFVATGKTSLKQVFLAMGEPGSSMFLAQRIHDFLDIKAIVPEKGDSFILK